MNRATLTFRTRFHVVALALALSACTPAVPPVATNPPAPTLGPTPTTSPACTFGGALPPPAPAPPLDAYAFEAPAVVFTSTFPLGVAGFLPDGQRLLITHVSEEAQYEYIEAINLQNDELQRYARRRRADVAFATRPRWLGSTVLYATWEGVVQVLNRGAPAPGGIARLTSPYFDADPTGQRAVFLSAETPDQPEVYELVNGTRTLLPVHLPLFPPADLAARETITQAQPYRMHWLSDGSRIAFYSNLGFWLADVNSGAACRVDLGQRDGRVRWALDAHWNADGRYAALLTTVGQPVVPYVELTLLDLAGGTTRQIDLGHPYAFSTDWLDARTLAVGVELERDASGARNFGIYLVDAVDGGVRPVLPERPALGETYLGIAWSPERHVLALPCVPATAGAQTVYGLCVIGVRAP